MSSALLVLITSPRRVYKEYNLTYNYMFISVGVRR